MKKIRAEVEAKLNLADATRLDILIKALELRMLAPVKFSIASQGDKWWAQVALRNRPEHLGAASLCETLEEAAIKAVYVFLRKG